MRKALRIACWSTLVSLSLGAALGIIWSELYWGYPLNPPSWRTNVARIRSVDAFQEVGLRGWHDCVPIQGASGASAIAAAARQYRDHYTDFMPEMLAFEIARASKPIVSSRPIPIGMFHAACQLLDRAGLLYSGESGHPNAKALSGALALVRSTRDELLLFASLTGLEASNDHYPIYQAVFSVHDGSLRLVTHRRFFVDIAGIEFATWWLVAAGASVLLFPVVAALVATALRRRAAT